MRLGSSTSSSTLEGKMARLVLFENARQVLENGMKLLGFPLQFGWIDFVDGPLMARLRTSKTEPG